MILERARSMAFEPGTNREGDPGPPLFLFLLPTLERAAVVMAGRVDERLASGLARWSPPRVLSPRDSVPEPCSVLALGDGLGAARVRSLLARVPPAACVIAAPAAMNEAAAGLGPTAWHWLLASGTPRRSVEPRERAALHVPRAEDRGRHWRARLRRIAFRALRRSRIRPNERTAFDPSGTWLETGGAPLAGDRRATDGSHAVFLPKGCDPLKPPAWLVACAASNGLALAGRPWSLLPARGYRSQKLLFGFGPTPDDAREIVVKVTQEPAFNDRLANEHRALARIAESGTLERATYPQPIFSAEHAGLAVVAESRIVGTPFRSRPLGDSHDRPVERAFTTLLRLASRTARRVPGAELAGSLRALAAKFVARYEPAPRVANAIDAALFALESEPSLPVVFFHGDCGDWNLLVTASGDVAFLDWENAEPEGPPLWDLFAFLHSLNVHAAEDRGERPTPAVCARSLLEPSPAADRWVRSVRQQRAKLDLPGRVVQPLLVLHAMYAALRETWRLSPDQLHQGRSFEMLRRIVDGAGSSEVLRRAATDGAGTS